MAWARWGGPRCQRVWHLCPKGHKYNIKSGRDLLAKMYSSNIFSASLPAVLAQSSGWQRHCLQQFYSLMLQRMMCKRDAKRDQDCAAEETLLHPPFGWALDDTAKQKQYSGTDLLRQCFPTFLAPGLTFQNDTLLGLT